MNRILIVDGHNLLFQMFFGMPTKIIGLRNQAIHGVIGFIGALNRLLDIYSPTHLCVMFDGEKENPRKDILEEYKANRIDYSDLPEEENPFSQLPIIYEALDYMGIKHTETTVCETDDVIAAYAVRFGDKSEVMISSFDSDYFQLITDKVNVIRYRGKCSVICNKEYIIDKYGIEPSLYLDFKCLIGDTSDNIPGIRGVGPKTATKLVNEFGDIAAIVKRSAEIKNEKIRAAIEGGVDVLKRNMALIKLSGDEDIPFSLEEIEFKNPHLKTMDVIRGIGH